MTGQTFLNGRVTLFCGDCIEAMQAMSENSVDSCVTDPPYELKFMGRDWDNTGIAFRAETWTKVLRVLKPGGHLLAFAAPRNAHRMFCAIEDAGFEIRDCLQWIFGSGFPKSHNQGEAWEGWGTALKPAYEPIVMARKPLIGTVAENLRRHGTGALNIDGCRVEYGEAGPDRPLDQTVTTNAAHWGGSRADELQKYKMNGRWPANIIHDGSDEVVSAFPESDSPQPYVRASGSASKKVYGDFPSRDGEVNASFGDRGSAARFFASFPRKDDEWTGRVNVAEPCFLLCHRPNAASVQLSAQEEQLQNLARSAQSVASLCDSCAIVIAQSLVAMRQGQNPAGALSQASISERNRRILSHSLVLFAHTLESTDTTRITASLKILLGYVQLVIAGYTSSERSAENTGSGQSRLRYTSKADAEDRAGSKHPTVKPLDLMQYLVRLVTPRGGTVLDCFAGTGTTGEAAWREGCKAILIEREPEYQADIERRVALCLASPSERIRATARSRPRDPNFEDFFESAP